MNLPEVGLNLPPQPEAIHLFPISLYYHYQYYCTAYHFSISCFPYVGFLDFISLRIRDLVTEIVDPEVAERPLIKTAYTWRWPLIQPTPGGSPSSHFCILYYNYYFYYYDNSISQYRHLYLYLPILPLSPSFKSLLSP